MAHLTREEILKSGEVAPEYRKVCSFPVFCLWIPTAIAAFPYHHVTNFLVLLDKTSQEPFQAFEARPIEITGSDVFEQRASRAAHLEKLRHLYPIPGPIPELVKETLHDVPTRDGASIRVKVYQPLSGPPDGGSPLIMMYHEGGWSMGDLTDEDLNCRMFARDLGAVCVNVEYRYA
jgi:acetyl esterase/lipase